MRIALRAYRKAYPQSFRAGCAVCGGGAGWVGGWSLSKAPEPVGLSALGLLLMVAVVFSVRELRGMRRRLAIMQLIQRGVATNDEGLLEVAYLEMKLMEPTAKKRLRQAEREDQAPRSDEG